MRSYLFIQDPSFAALPRISPGEVPALFCIREADLSGASTWRTRLGGRLARVTRRLTRRSAVTRTAYAPPARTVDPTAVPR